MKKIVKIPLATTEDLDKNDSKNNTVTFDSGDAENPTAWKNVATLSSKEKHSSLFSKISTMFSNVRYLYKLLGTTDISALGTVTQALANLDGNVGDIKGIISSLADCSAATVAGYAADALAVKELNSNLTKVYISGTTTSQIAGNSDGSITFNCPPTYSEILGCIPLYVSVTQTWETYAVVSGVNLNNKSITIHTFGSTTQNYYIAYAVLYR